MSWHDEIQKWQKSVGVSSVRNYADKSIIDQTLEFSNDELFGLDPQTLQKYCLALSRYILYVQAELNRLYGQTKYYQNKLQDTSVLLASEYRGATFIERKTQAINKEKKCIKLKQALEQKKYKLQMLYMIPERLEKFRQTLERIYYSRRKKEGTDT